MNTVENQTDHAEKLAEKPEKGGGVQSLARAFSILEEVGRAAEGVGLADISKAVGLHNSTTFHLVKTMVQLGYLRQDRENKRYRLGRPLFSLAASALNEIELINITTPYLEELADETKESCHFAIASGCDVIIIARADGSGAFRLSERMGTVRPAHATALGKVLLAARDSSQLERYFKDRHFESYTPNTITDPQRLLDEIETVRKNGIAFDDAEFHLEVRCAAAPVYDFTGQVTGSVGISGPIWRISLAALQEKTESLRDMAQRISAELGYKGTPYPHRRRVVAEAR